MKVLKKYSIRFFYASLLVGGALFVGCNPANRLGDGQQLLVKNKVEVLQGKRNIRHLDEVKDYLKQKPNKRLFYLVRFHLGVYNIAHRWNSKKHDKGVFDWLENTVGEKPVVYDSTLSHRSARNMQQYLFNKGYYNAVVKDSVFFKGRKKKKAKVYYTIRFDQRYRIQQIEYLVKDSVFLPILEADSSNSLIKKGEFYDAEKIDAERIRLERLIQNSGYYAFNREFIRFYVDSAKQNHTVNITLEVDDRKGVDVNAYRSKVYKINKVFVDTEHFPMRKSMLEKDTLSFDGRYFFLYEQDLNYIPRQLLKSVFIFPDSTYSRELTEYTYQRFSDLKSFRYINIYFDEEVSEKIQDTVLLNCTIQLTPVKRQSYTLEFEGTNSQGNLGVAGNILYQHRNLFKGSELFNLKFKGAMEFQQLNQGGDELLTDYLPFNTYEYGAEASLIFPRFLMPFKIRRRPETQGPKTSVASGYNYQLRPDYNRAILNVSFGYEWRNTKYTSHYYSPLDYNYVSLDKDSLFNANILATRNPTIINSFRSHLIAGMKYYFVYNNQQARPNKNFVFFRGGVELAGNVLRGLSPYLRLDQLVDGGYTLLNVRYAQYVRPSIDFRYYARLSDSKRLVFRQTIGLGLPYGNNLSLPFEKSFFAGGANSMRGWKLYELGPGGTSGQALSTRIGDMQLETNLEYRYTLYKDLKGALFVDAGNIWMVKKEEERPGADFDFNRFYKELAVASGLGLRYDFTYFILRLDLAIKMRDPSRVEQERWVYKEAHFKTINYNIGIGYPF